MATETLKTWDAKGRLVAQREVEIPVEQANESLLRVKADQAITALEQADTGWPGLTVAQKDQALRLAVRTVAKLARLVLGKLDSP